MDLRKAVHLQIIFKGVFEIACYVLGDIPGLQLTLRTFFKIIAWLSFVYKYVVKVKYLYTT